MKNKKFVNYLYKYAVYKQNLYKCWCMLFNCRIVILQSKGFYTLNNFMFISVVLEVLSNSG